MTVAGAELGGPGTEDGEGLVEGGQRSLCGSHGAGDSLVPTERRESQPITLLAAPGVT